MGWRLSVNFQVFLVHEDDAGAFPGCGDLEQGPESGPGPDGDYAPLLDGVDVDGIEHRRQYSTALRHVGLLPQGRQVLQEPPGSHRRVGVRYNQRPQSLFELLLLTAILIVGKVTVNESECKRIDNCP